MKTSKENLEILATYMDDEIREAVHSALSPCTSSEFLQEYVKRDPKFRDLMEKELSRYYQG